MKRSQINGWISPSAAERSASPLFAQPNYSSPAVQEALEHLASVDLIELCGEAKVEHCRATRDLRSCGRYVQYVLNSCGHASLCSECSQRCDLCPICRTPILKSGNRLRLRLYYECIEAGLILTKCDERFQEKEDWDDQLAPDVQRLYALFDVAMENNLVSLICHYITDVCMDETAVSSDPVIAFLLDEVVVKDWCKRMFRRIVEELQDIYALKAEEMRTRLNLLHRLSTYLVGISSVLEVLESSFKSSLSAKLHDLQLLQEIVLKTRQHMEVIIWCIRHQFLENMMSRYSPFTSWKSILRERKLASIKRSWPDAINQPSESSTQVAGSLFIEDALMNIELEHPQGIGEESDLASLAEDGESFLRSKIEGLVGCYPFENLRTAADLLFLHGSSDMVLAKQAINQLVYYLFDRHWTLPDDSWRDIVDDFAATFGITRHSLLESLAFYLLDDHTEEALKEVCDLLPEISGPSTHPKITQVLLEREVPEMALMVLRWSGCDGSHMVSLIEAVTAIRVRLECGLLTEAFMYQREVCTKVKEKKWKGGLLGEASIDSKGKCRTWEEWLEILVSEICCLCIKSNLVDRMIELPWNLDEEKHIYKCLLDVAVHDPSTTAGSLLVVYYLQRYRYAVAYQVDLKLQMLDQEFISKNTLNEEVLSRMRSASRWRAELVSQSIQLLPQLEQQQIKAGKLLPELHHNSGEAVERSAVSNRAVVQEPHSSILLAPESVDSSLVLGRMNGTPFRPEAFETPSAFGGSISNSCSEFGIMGSASALHERLFAQKGLKPEISIHKSVQHDVISTSRTQLGDLVNASPFKEIRTSSNLISKSSTHQQKSDKFSPEREQNGVISHIQNTSSPYTRRVTADPVSAYYHEQDFPNDHGRIASVDLSSKMVNSHMDGKLQKFSPAYDPMDVSWSGREKGDKGVNGGPRWRSDETSDEDEDCGSERAGGKASYAIRTRGKRRSQFAKR